MRVRVREKGVRESERGKKRLRVRVIVWESRKVRERVREKK